MIKQIGIFFVGAMLAVAPPVSTSHAQQQTQRIAGTIEGVDGPAIIVKTRQGNEVKVTLTDSVAVFGVVKKSVSDITAGSYVGVGGIPQPDGSQLAVRISILAESQRGLNEGLRPWDGAPQGTMVNATVETTVVNVDGQILMLKYKDGEKKIIVTPTTQITANVRGDKSELTPGASILITQAMRKPDGTFEASRVNVGRDGVVPQ
jgi:Domain of unknown function (DUF5666)